MAKDLGPPSRFIALNIQGDVGPWTCYTSSRGRMVTFLRAPPLNPPTPTQEHFRDQFRNAASKWRQAPADTRAAWRTAAAAANLGITGYNLWTWYCHTRDDVALATVERAYGATLPRPPS